MTKNRLKIIYILDQFPTISETFILNEMVSLLKKGVCVEVLSLNKGGKGINHPRVEEIKVINYLQKTGFRKKILAHLYWVFKNPEVYLRTMVIALNRSNGISRLFLMNLHDVIFIEKSNPTHIHAHFASNASNLAMLAFLLTRIPFTFTSHGSDIFINVGRNLKLKSRLAKRHITISEFNREYIVRHYGVRREDISVVYSGIDFSYMNVEGSRKQENLIVSIARLEHIKGLDVLLKACCILKNRNIDFKCLIIGEGSQRKNLLNMIKEGDMSAQVKLLGSKKQDEVFELLSKAVMKVLPSRSESMGVALMEAMAFKIAVIGPNIYGVNELIEDGKSGFLVLPEDDKMLAEKIEILLKNKGLRRKLSAEGYKKVRKKFDLYAQTNELLKIWKG